MGAGIAGLALGRALRARGISAEIIEVPPDLPAREVAKRLAEKHIHRIFVSGKNGPVGVISTMDVLKSVAGVAKIGLHA